MLQRRSVLVVAVTTVLVVLLLCLSFHDQNVVVAEDDGLLSDVETLSDAHMSGKCLRVYGNYCGPGWCNNKWWNGCHGKKASVLQCNTSKNGRAIDAVDKCCRTHDGCCNSTKRKGTSCKNCDRNLLNCLNRSTCKDEKCKRAKTVMQMYYSLVHVGCCGLRK